MFAGCVDLAFETPGSASSPGDRLIAHAREDGLAGIPFDDLAVWQNAGVTLIQQRQWHTPESRLESGVMGDEFLRILFWGRIDNRKELIAALADNALPELIKTDTGLVLNAWKRWGPDCCAQLVGDFAFVVYQTQGDHLFLARDHFGVKPLYFYRTQNQLVFATSLTVLAGLDSLGLNPSREWMARYMLGISPDWRRTAYEFVEKIQPAHSLLWSTTDPENDQRAWYRFTSPQAIELQSEEAYVRAYRDLLDRAVRDRLRSTGAVGSECSGGLDSSSICASAECQFLKATGHNPEEGLGLFASTFLRDEPEAVKQVASHIKHQFLYIVDDSSDEEGFDQIGQQYLDVVGCPPEHGNAIAQQPFYQEAQQRNLGVMLSGFGGDEFSSSYATQALVDLWRQKKWRLWGSRFRGGWVASKLRMLKWLFRYIFLGPGTATSTRNRKFAEKTWALSPFSGRDDWPDLRAELIRRHRYDEGAQSLNEFVLNDRLSPTISARLESCTLMAARYGIEYRWPLLDIRLVEFFLAVPPEQKIGKGGVGRYLHRRAVDDLLPQELVWRDKDMGPPLSSQKNHQFLYDINSNINNSLNNIINVDYINSLQKEWSSGYSEDLPMIESILGRFYALNHWLCSDTDRKTVKE